MQQLTLYRRELDFNKLENDLKEAATLSERLEIMYQIAQDNGFYKPILLIADNGQVVYGIDILTDYRAQIVGGFLLKKTLELRYYHAKTDLDRRLNSCTSDDAKATFIKAELQHYRAPLERFEAFTKTAALPPPGTVLSPYCLGFNSEKRKVIPGFPTNLDRSIYEEIEKGMINYRLDAYLTQESIEVSKSENFIENHEYNFAIFSTPSAAILFYKETGIYDLLIAKYRVKAKVAKILAILTNIKSTSIEPLLGKIEFSKASIGKNSPYNLEAIDEVLAKFNQLNIDTANLHMIRREIEKR